jgi:hypothetical protein
MKTTLQLDDDLVRDAKRRAVDEGKTLTGLIEEALRLFLSAPPASAEPFVLQLLTKRGRTLPGVDLEDRDALYERMDSRK